jgi:putative transcription factor
MPECEICGRKVATVYEITLDGAQMLVCEKDAQGRDVLKTFGTEERKRESAKAAPVAKESGPEEIIENYGEKIRAAREALGLPLKVLAEKISEKESTLTRVEKQETLPSEKTRQKLEKELGIKLLSKGTEEKKFVAAKKNEPVTLWDLAKKEKEEGE